MKDELSWNEICDIMSFRDTPSKDKIHQTLDELLRDLDSDG